MAGVGTRATAADFNAIQSVISSVMGIGSGTQGYGQTIASATVSANAAITEAQWDNIRSDLTRARVHQTNTAVATNSTATGSPWQTLFDVTNSTVISESIRAQYQSFVDNGVNLNRFTMAAAQSTPDSVLSTTTRTASWGAPGNLSISHTITVTWPGYGILSAADHMRCFFNAGGFIQIRASRTGAAATSKDTDWTNMLGNGTVNSGFGDVIIRGQSSTYTGSIYGSGFAFPTSTGFHTMSSSSGAPTRFMNQGSFVTQYAENRYILDAYKTANTMVFTVTFQDADTGDQTGLGPGVDETVTGTLTSTCLCTYPSGANVAVNPPTASATAL
jgi:hypothetical protein